MAKQPPTQELVAKDLHGNEWHFRHIFREKEETPSFMRSSWSIMLSALSLNLLDSSSKGPPTQGSDIPYQAPASVGYGGFREYPMLQSHRAENQQGSWLMPPPPTSHFQNVAYSREVMSKPVLVQQEAAKPTNGNCKLFGISIFNSAVTSEPSLSNKNWTSHPPNQPHANESDRKYEESNGSKELDLRHAERDQDKSFHSCHSFSRDGSQGKVPGGSSRSCTKVHKRGIALGRSVDLSKFNNYEELVAELDQLFEFHGELMSLEKKWLIVYTDDEGDIMLVGDDPWHEFCALVRKICIYTKEEVQTMKPGKLNAKDEDHPSSVEGMEATTALPPSASSS